jgi:NAD(P)-dependent dehydrogenase (short-subunit alcohol dehydrogenase family)
MFEKMFDIKNKVVIITGGAGLIGSRYAVALSEKGAYPIIADLNGKKAIELAQSLPAAKGLGIGVDITNPDSIKVMLNSVLDKFGKIDALVNNAALDPKFDPEHADQHSASFENLSLDVWRQSLEVNMTGMFLCTQAVVRQMLKQKKGVIVNVSSIYGMCGPDQRLYEKNDGSIPNYKPITYTVTKSAVFGFTKYLAAYYGRKGIRVNTLTLGGVFNNHEKEFAEKYSWRTTIGRMADKDEYCGALIYLISDASSYMTGSNLVVDGGWTAW